MPATILPASLLNAQVGFTFTINWEKQATHISPNLVDAGVQQYIEFYNRSGYDILLSFPNATEQLFLAAKDRRLYAIVPDEVYCTGVVLAISDEVYQHPSSPMIYAQLYQPSQDPPLAAYETAEHIGQERVLSVPIAPMYYTGFFSYALVNDIQYIDGTFQNLDNLSITNLQLTVHLYDIHMSARVNATGGVNVGLDIECFDNAFASLGSFMLWSSVLVANAANFTTTIVDNHPTVAQKKRIPLPATTVQIRFRLRALQLYGAGPFPTLPFNIVVDWDPTNGGVASGGIGQNVNLLGAQPETIIPLPTSPQILF